MTADLPPEIAGLIHPERLANERAYWVARDGLLAEYGGLWVRYSDGRVVVSGRSPVAVLAAAEATGLLPHLACAGREGEPDRVRWESFAYDATWSGSQVRGAAHAQVRPRSGAATMSPPRSAGGPTRDTDLRTA